MTQEGNKLIAKFMSQFPGYQKHYHKAEKDYVYDNPNTAEALTIRYSGFHESWDWLMPVVEKIEELDKIKNPRNDCGTETIPPPKYLKRFHYHIYSTGCEIIDSLGDKPLCISKSPDDYPPSHNTLELIYTTIVDFIKWYNSQNQNYPEDTDSNTRI